MIMLLRVNANKTSVRKKGRYSLELKRKILNHHSNGNILNKCETEFGVDRRLIGSWKQKSELIMNTKVKRLRFKVQPKNDCSKFPLMEKD